MVCKKLKQDFEEILKAKRELVGILGMNKLEIGDIRRGHELKGELKAKTKELEKKLRPFIDWQEVRKFPGIKIEAFPEKKISIAKLITDPKINSPQSAIAALESKNIYVDLAKYILAKTKFIREEREYELVRFKVADLGFPDGATTEEIYARAQELGLHLCPAEVGPHLKRQSSDQGRMFIAMEPIIDSHGDQLVFLLGWVGDGLGLGAFNVMPGERCWSAKYQLVFCARKLET